MNKQVTITQLLERKKAEQEKAEQEKAEQEAKQEARVHTPPQIKLEKTKTKRQNVINALTNNGVKPNPSKLELKWINEKNEEIAVLEEQIVELEKQIEELDLAAAMVPATPEEIQAAQEVTKTDAIEAFSEILPEIQENVGGDLKAQVQTVINEIEKVKSRETTPVSPISDYKFEDARSRESSPVSPISDYVFEDALSRESSPVSNNKIKIAEAIIQEYMDNHPQIKNTAQEYADFKKSYPEIFKKDNNNANLEEIEEAIEEKNENDVSLKKASEAVNEAINDNTNETESAVVDSLVLFEEIRLQSPNDLLSLIYTSTNSWIVSLQLFFTKLWSMFPELSTMMNKFGNIYSFLKTLLLSLFTFSKKTCFFIGKGLWKIITSILWGLSGVISSIEWKRHFNKLRQIMSNIDCREFFRTIGFNINQQLDRIRFPVARDLMIKKTRQLQNELIDFALPRGNKNNNSNTNNSSFAFCDNNSSRRNNLACLSMEDNYLNDDDDDDEPVFLSHKKSASSAKPEPKYPPQNSENPSSCEVIKSEVPCENFSYIKPGKKLRTKCNWFKQRTPKCKETKRNERNDVIDALLTQLRGRSDQEIEIYVNNPNSDIYRHWHAGPRELLNRVLSLKYTHGPGPLARNGGNKTRKGQRKGGNKTRKGQRNGGNKTRRKQNK